MRLFLVTLAALCACSTPAEPTGSQRTCEKDLECGSHAYCTVAHLCRTDCYSDTDCLGPTTTAQCNTHGRCVETVEPEVDSGPEDTAKPDGAGADADASTDEV